MFRSKAKPQTLVTCGEQSASAMLAEDSIRVRMNVSGLTDAGAPMKQNQDTLFSYSDGQNIVLGIFDGHGRESGHLASLTARNFFFEKFKEQGTFNKVAQDTEATLRTMYKECHEAIYQSFKSYYLKQGFTVQESKTGGFLVKRKKRSQPFTCVQGGTTVTIVVILGGKKVIISNVGDSMACLGGQSLGFSQMKAFNIDGPAYASPYTRSFGQEDSVVSTGPVKTEDTDCPEVTSKEDQPHDPLILSADHSPESETEFYRVRAFRKAVEDPNLPEMLFMYDAPNHSKYDRVQMYTADNTGTLSLTGSGKYYKNVRNEWASLVITPPHAQFQDALAFTRSVGDFYLHSYGVTHEPDIFELDLEEVLQTKCEEELHGHGEKNLVLLIATDGVWDNWQFKDATSYLLDPQRIKKSREENGMNEIVKEFMSLNITYAKELFGNHADNMTAMVCYINAVAL